MDAIAAPGQQTLRAGRHSRAGAHYLVTSVCCGREPRFRAWDCASRVAAAIDHPRLWRDSRPLCWALLPDHLLVLVELGGSEALPALMQRVNWLTGELANAIDHRDGGVWMPGFHDRPLRSEDTLAAARRYVIAKPVRAGLVRRVGDYPYWNSLHLPDDVAEWT